MSEAVLLDTSFFIRLLNREEKLHHHAKGYYRYFLDRDYTLIISTISIAEYCVIGERTDLPLKQLKVLPFNIDHAEQAGHFANILFRHKNSLKKKGLPRANIPNDAKLLAQAHMETNVVYYVTADKRSDNLVKILHKVMNIDFQFIDIHTPWNEQFGELFNEYSTSLKI